MCGIAGIVKYEGSFDPSIIERMTQTMEHRGPDGFAFYKADKIALGHRRLAIIDLSEGGKQPKQDISGRFVITFNGEIYNYKQVKTILQPLYAFDSNSDTEVILNAYRHWGEDCVLYLKGQFAFAVWDKEKEELFIARDRVGEKPLYYFHKNGVFIFASEITALLNSGLVPKKISEKGLVEFLTYQAVHTPETILKDVFQLPAASKGLLKKGGSFIFQKYWNIEDFPLQIEDDFDNIKRKTKNLLSKAIEGQMLSDVPLGAFLSGGIDSSAIVALMAEQTTEPINTFSIIFDEKEFDESPYSNLIAKKFNTKHEAIKLKPTALLDELPNFLEKMDTPSGDGLNTYTVSKAVKNAGITVALSGLGGDELFCGYRSFADYLNLTNNKALFNNTPQFLKNITANILLSLRNDSKSAKIAALLQQKKVSLAGIYSLARQNFSPTEIKQILPSFPKYEDKVISFLQALEPNIGTKIPYMSAYSIAELNGYTQNVLLRDSDSMGMAHSLEIRVPFFDHELIEYVMGLPDSVKYSTKTPKSLLVHSLSPLLPDEIVYRAKKGFSFPWHLWMQQELRPFVSANIQALSKRNIFDKKALLNYYEAYEKGSKSISWTKIWLLVILENWLKKHNF